MDIRYFTPLFTVIICNLCYQLISKNLSADINPFMGLVATYGIACAVCIVLFLFTNKAPIVEKLQKINPSNVLLGIVLVGIEAGYIIMYRKGWTISTGSLIVNITLSILLIIIGFLFFKENLTLQKLIGTALCLLGAILIL